MVGWFNRRLRRDREEGAALVEFAFVLPFLLLIVLGIVEFGWVFGNHLDVRHGAREAARLAAVDAGSGAAMAAIACDAMDFSDGQEITFTLLTTEETGEEAEVTVDMVYTSLTGFAQIAVPNNLSTTVRIRLEQDADTWVGDSGSIFTCMP